MRLGDLQIQTVSETDRVLALPRVDEYPTAMAWADATFKAPWCKWNFRQHQAEALYIAHRLGGAILPIGVGHGKTLVFWLSPKALGVKRAVGMMPPRDVTPYLIEIERYRDVGFLDDPGVAYSIVPYSTLSQPDCSRLLSSYDPQAIICDEAHTLANITSARTKRFLHYMATRPETKFVAMSGTLFSRSVTDVAHLANLALREHSPLPRFGAHLSAWSACLDVGADPMPHERKWFEPVIEAMGVGDTTFGFQNRAREAAHRRFVSGEGVITTDTASCDLPLTLATRYVEPPEHLVAMADAIRESQELDGELLVTEEVASMVARDVLNGFYYAMDWGDRQPSQEWLMATRAYSRALRGELTANSRPDYDSPALIERSLEARLAADPEAADKSQLVWLYTKVKEVKHLAPGRRTIWLDTYLIDWLMANYERGEPLIVWYESQAIEDELKRRGVPCHGSGSDLAGPARYVAASYRVHGQARRLHEWQRAVVLELPASGKTWEQLLGRLHRAGQTEPVQFDLVLNSHTSYLIRQIKQDAEFIGSMTGSPQRLLTASWV